MKKITLMLCLIFVSSFGYAKELTKSQKLEIQEAVKKELKDPDSAKFKWEKVHDKTAYCGLVNAKNSYGGFTGYVPFVVVLGIKPVIVMKMGSGGGEDTDSQVVYEVCRKSGYFLDT